MTTSAGRRATAPEDGVTGKASPNAFSTLNAVRDAVGMSGTEKSVLIFLALHADGKTGERAFPSYETLAREACTALRTVKYAVSHLEEVGLIVRGDQCYAPKRPQGGKKVIVWNLNLTAIRAMRHTGVLEGEQPAPASYCPHAEENQHAPHALSNVHLTTEQRAPHAHKQPLEQPIGTTPNAAAPSADAPPQADGVPALGAKRKRLSPKAQRQAEEIEEAKAFLSDVYIDDKSEVTADTVISRMKADGVTHPGSYLRQVEEKSGGNGNGVQGYIDSRGYTMAERGWEEFREIDG